MFRSEAEGCYCQTLFSNCTLLAFRGTSVEQRVNALLALSRLWFPSYFLFSIWFPSSCFVFKWHHAAAIVVLLLFLFFCSSCLSFVFNLFVVLSKRIIHKSSSVLIVGYECDFHHLFVFNVIVLLQSLFCSCSFLLNFCLLLSIRCYENASFINPRHQNCIWLWIRFSLLTIMKIVLIILLYRRIISSSEFVYQHW